MPRSLPIDICELISCFSRSIREMPLRSASNRFARLLLSEHARNAAMTATRYMSWIKWLPVGRAALQGSCRI